MSIQPQTELYRAAITFGCQAHDIIERLPPGDDDLVHRLVRASIELPARIAESTLEEADEEDRARAHSEACGVTCRSAAILDLLEIAFRDSKPNLAPARGTLEEVWAMLTG